MTTKNKVLLTSLNNQIVESFFKTVTDDQLSEFFDPNILNKEISITNQLQITDFISSIKPKKIIHIHDFNTKIDAKFIYENTVADANIINAAILNKVSEIELITNSESDIYFVQNTIEMYKKFSEEHGIIISIRNF
mgnify:CR=1 FL=1